MKFTDLYFQRRTKIEGRFLSKLVYKFLPSQNLVHLSHPRGGGQLPKNTYEMLQTLAELFLPNSCTFLGSIYFQRRQKPAEGWFLSKWVYKFLPSQKLVHLSGYFKRHIGGGQLPKIGAKSSKPQLNSFCRIAELFWVRSVPSF